MRRPDARYALWVAALASLALVPLAAGFAGLGWELAQIAGLVAALACIGLCGAPLRPRIARPSPALSLKTHRLIGWIAVLAVALHVGGLVLADRPVVEYLKLTAPLYQLAGIAAALLLLVLVLSALGRPRRRVFTSHRGFQATHVILGCLLVVLTAVHVVATRRYLGGTAQRVLWLAGSGGAILLLLRYRRPGNAETPAASRGPRLVFGRHSPWVLGCLAALSVSLAALSLHAADDAARRSLAARPSALPLDFPHAKHVAVNCLECHHNYADGDFSNTCVACHRSARTDLKMPAEPRFHGYCLDCHRHPDAKLMPGVTRHGPVAGCTVCHQPPTLEDARMAP